MIKGIGTDLIESQRVIKACEKEAFLEKYFTPAEIALIRKDKRRAANNFSVKEAVAKMFGTGFRTIKPIEIEVLRDELGRPYVNLYGKAKELETELGIEVIHVSISDTNRYASAYVVGEGN